MPFYQDPQFNSRYLTPCASTFTASLTGTATNASGLLSANFFPTFVRRSAVRNVVVTVLTAAGASQAGFINFMNGTSTFATATIGTLTAGQVAIAVGNANSTFADLTAATGTIIGTATSAGTNAGGFAVWFDVQELYE